MMNGFPGYWAAIESWHNRPWARYKKTLEGGDLPVGKNMLILDFSVVFPSFQDRNKISWNRGVPSGCVEK